MQFPDELAAMDDPHAAPGVCRWYAGAVSCQLCGEHWTAVWCDCSLGLECPACGTMAGMPEVAA